LEENKKQILVKRVYPTPRESLKISWRGSNMQDWKQFNNVFLTDESLNGKENSIREEKFKIRCLKTQLEIFKVQLNLLRA